MDQSGSIEMDRKVQSKGNGAREALGGLKLASREVLNCQQKVVLDVHLHETWAAG